MQTRTEHLKGVFAIVMACFLWGTTGTVANYAPSISPLAIGAFSMGVGGVLLVFKARNKLLVDYKLMLAQPKILVLGSISVAIYPLAFYTSMRLSGVAIGTVISLATAPFFAAVLERLICKKILSKHWLFSFIVGVIGIALLVAGKQHSEHGTENINQQSLGVLLGCVAGLTYASYSWSAKRLIDNGVDSQSSMSGLFGFAAMLLLPSLWFSGENLFLNSTNILVSLYMALIPMFLGYLLFGFGLKFIEASDATLITLIEPIIATILAVFILQERFEFVGWVGVVLVSLCLLMQTYKPKSHQNYL